MDNLCQTKMSPLNGVTSFYGIYTEDGDYTGVPVGTYNMSLCDSMNWDINGAPTNPAASICPIRDRFSYCPCFNMFSTEQCYSKDCRDSDIDKTTTSTSCNAFAASSMGACHCFDNLLTMVATMAPQEVITTISTMGDDICAEFLASYSATSGLTYAISIVTVVVNTFLMGTLKKLSVWEKHSDLADEQGSYLSKVFLALYINLTFVVLVAYGEIDDAPQALKNLYIFQGPYDDFTAAWFSDVGLFLVFTFFIQSISVLWKGYYEYYIFYPFRRWWHFSAVDGQRSYHFAMQDELNDIVVAPVFDPTQNQALQLALLFTTMTFATGKKVHVYVYV